MFFDVLNFLEQLFFFGLEDFLTALPTLHALADIVAVIAAIIFRAGGGHFKNAVRHMVKKIAVVRNDQHCARPFAQVALQPFHSRNIKMVGRFIKQKHVRLGEQQLGEIGACALPAGEMVDRHLKIGCGKSQTG